jgi:hypothetical protein
MLTAKEARKLAGVPDEDTIREAVEIALDRIEHEARSGKRVAKIHNNFWVHEGYSGTAQYTAACKQLADLGYKVKFFYEERQFVDMYTIVEW